MPKTSILIVTHEKDFVWLEWCLKSIEKFASGFQEVLLALPDNTPIPEFLMQAIRSPRRIPLRFWTGPEWPGNGMMWHMFVKMNADQVCPDSDFIMHMDADCIFCEPATPEDYFSEGRPQLMYAPYDWVVSRFNNPTFYNWKRNVTSCLGGNVSLEFMRRHPAVHYRDLYPMAREKVELFTGLTLEGYMKSFDSVFPQKFCEFNTLGEVAWRSMWPKYRWIAQHIEGRPHDKLIEFWSHSPIDKPQELTWTDAPNRKFVPIEVIQRVLG